ncbi:protein DGCR6L isoform X3 [Lepus europaeus]|uniref:protein DGCR6L isoform X3 n=1 Tax=Lepus europaeus TaxID=9983 RepID=UPI002B4A2A74|nr:protein DGCR6L isoform X3 [Lepus europaeus]
MESRPAGTGTLSASPRRASSRKTNRCSILCPPRVAPLPGNRGVSCSSVYGDDCRAPAFKHVPCGRCHHRVLKQALRQKHQEAQQACRPHNLPVLQAAQQRELEAVEHRIREEQRAMDRKIVLELDRKVADQQSTLEKAGVAGFYVTTNPQELTLQMNLLELIRKLQQRGCQAGKAAL